ncbi:MAG: hypothetical protein WBF42_18730 [Terracidiphilus sp.]
METFLNLAWLLLALSSICLWARFEQRTGTERRLPIVALLMLIVILFPVISVTDDLWSLHNPAETDVLLRRDHHGVSTDTVAVACPYLCQPEFAEIVLVVWHIGTVENRPVSSPPSAPFAAIQNRPPPPTA